MKKKTIYIFSSVALFLLAGFGVYQSTNSAPTTTDKVGKGDKAPEIAQLNPQGDTLRLSDLEGNLVLIDFWASWCRPCLAKLPKLKKLYKNFKDKSFKNADSFTVFSVSLDKSKRNWKKAIRKFDLNWKYHVSDLKGWRAQPASKYGVRRIPFTFLVNEKGVIIARNWHLDDVRWELEKRVEEQ